MSEEIILCNKCKGEGSLVHSELVDHHRGEYNTYRVQCDRCKGTGRLVKRVTEAYSAYQELLLS